MDGASDPSRSPANKQPAPEAAPARKMVQATLLGAHSHVTTCGIQVHVYQRDGKYLARGRFERRPFGETLGSDVQLAQAQLRHLLTDLEAGRFRRPSEKRKQPFKNSTVPQLPLRQLCGEFLVEKRSLRGHQTASDYRNRLAHVLDFAERQDVLGRWPLARDLNREFALKLREFLVRRQTTRNGRPGAELKPLAPRYIQHCLETLRAVLAWAIRADVRKLPPEFVNPITQDIVGPAPVKNPLRQVKVPLDRRIEIVQIMDEWQFLHLVVLLVLPLRFEDVAGLLISDIDFEQRTLHLGTRFGGSDFNKSRLDILMPLPPALLPILKACAAGRLGGPLFRSRSVWLGRRLVRAAGQSPGEIDKLFHKALAAAPAGRIQTEQDQKDVLRQLLAKLGGVSERQIGRELRALFNRVGIPRGVRTYEIRGSVSQDLKDADMRHLELRYLTEHSVGDIMNDYTRLDPVSEMEKYFKRIQRLLSAIADRAGALGSSEARDRDRMMACRT